MLQKPIQFGQNYEYAKEQIKQMMTFTWSNRRHRDESNVRTNLVLRWVSDSRMGSRVTHHRATNHKRGQRTRRDVNMTLSVHIHTSFYL